MIYKSITESSVKGFNAHFQHYFSYILVEENCVSRENHRPAASHWQTLSHIDVSSTPRLSVIQTHSVIGESLIA